MVAHFADIAVVATQAGLYGAGLLVSLFMRGRTLTTGGNGFGERATLKFLKLSTVFFSTLVLYVAYALDPSFGHRIAGGHQIDRARYILWTIINPLFIGVVGLSYSASEHYAIIGSFVQLIASAMSLIGAWNCDSGDAATWFAILGIVFQAASGVYLLFMCVPSPEWQAQHGGSAHYIQRAIFAVMMLYFPIAFMVDNTYRNTIHDDARKLAIATLIIGSLIQVVGGLWLLISQDVVPVPPLGFNLGGTGGGGLFTPGASNWQFQNLQANSPASAEMGAAPAAQAGKWELKAPSYRAQ